MKSIWCGLRRRKPFYHMIFRVLAGRKGRSRTAKLAGSLFAERRGTKGLAAEVSRAVELLQEGFSLALVPEPTATDGSVILPFRNAYSEAARQARVPILPVCIQYREETDPTCFPAGVIVRYRERRWRRTFRIFPAALIDKKKWPLHRPFDDALSHLYFRPLDILYHPRLFRWASPPTPQGVRQPTEE